MWRVTKHLVSELRLVQLVLVAVAAGFTVSCASGSSPTAAGTRGRFQDTAAVNVALQFYRWDSIYMIRPDTRENGFFPIYGRDDIARELNRRGLGRELAVVVLGLVHSPSLENELIRDWETFLSGCGFRRVVFLRAGSRLEIDGLPIVRDSVIAAARDESGTTAALASLPSAP